MLKFVLNILLAISLVFHVFISLLTLNSDIKIPSFLIKTIFEKLDLKIISIKSAKINDNFEIACEDLALALNDKNSLILKFDKIYFKSANFFRSVKILSNTAKLFYNNNKIGKFFVKIDKCDDFVALNTFGQFLNSNSVTIRTEPINISEVRNIFRSLTLNNESRCIDNIINSYKFASTSNIFINSKCEASANVLIDKALSCDNKFELDSAHLSVKNLNNTGLDFKCFVGDVSIFGKKIKDAFCQSFLSFNDSILSLKNNKFYGKLCDAEVFSEKINCELYAAIGEIGNVNKISFVAKNSEFSIQSSNSEYFVKSKKISTNIDCTIEPSFFNNRINSKIQKFVQNISMRSKIYANIILRSDFQSHDINVVAETSNIAIADNQVQKNFSTARIYRDTIKVKSLIAVDTSTANLAFKLKNGEALLSILGILNPYLSINFVDIFPNWWPKFWSNFKFLQNYQNADVVASFDINNKRSFAMFGRVGADNFEFSNISLANFYMDFANIPGLCFFNSKKFITIGGCGNCTVYWPYSLKDENLEKWIVRGSGNLPIIEWARIMDFFGDKEKNIAIDKIVDSSNSVTHASFCGEIFGTSCASELEKALKINVNIKTPKIFGVQFDSLSTDCEKTRNALTCNNLLAKTNNAEIGGNLSLRNNKDITIDVAIKNLDTQHVLESSKLLSGALKDIEQAKLKPYFGNLNAEITGSGSINSLESFCITGSAKLEGKKIAKIHLLGPLSHLLLSKKIITQSAIRFNKIEGAFSLKNGIIRTENAVASSNSSKATIKGAVNLQTGEIEANMDFSFFDHHKMNVPILKQVFQLLQPISKGFKANLSGTFVAPKWALGFNPLRFLF